MATMLTNFVVVLVIVGVASVPLIVLAHRNQLGRTIRNFAVAAVVVAFISAAIAGASQRSVDQCRAAGNPGCFDSGRVGMQAIFAAGYVIAAGVRAFDIYRTYEA